MESARLLLLIFLRKILGRKPAHFIHTNVVAHLKKTQ